MTNFKVDFVRVDTPDTQGQAQHVTIIICMHILVLYKCYDLLVIHVIPLFLS